VAGHLRLARSRVEGLEHRLKALDPAATLRRGFSVVQIRASGRVVTSTAQVTAGDLLTITVADGSVPATAGANAARKKGKPPPKAPLMERLL
jgi:exonuclease VII large subunit